MTILITGGSGFIGSFIVEHLLSKGEKVIIPTRSVNACWRLQKHKDMTIIEGDISQFSFQEDLFKSYKPQIVIHTAWEGMTRDKRDDPAQINNLIMMDHLLRLTAEYKVKLFIGFGSQAEYGVINQEIDEQTSASPDNLYGVYKLAAGFLGQWYAKKHGFNYAWLRLFSSFGPKDWEDYIIPYVIQSFLKGEPPRLSSCEQQWDYLYVKDIARMVGKVIEKKGKFCDIYNLSSGESLCLRDIVEMLKDMTQTKVQPQFGALPLNPNGLMYLKGNNQKFCETFGDENKTSLAQALKETVEWYKKHLAGGTLGRS